MSVKKSPKIEKLVVGAIRKLQDVQGSTPREISNYISQEYDVPSTKIQRQVRLALARAVSYGILQRSKGGFYACNREFIGCQPQTEELKRGGKCGGGGGRRMKRARSSRRRKGRAGGGCCKSGGRRKRQRGGCGRRSRRRSRRGKSSGGRCGGKRRRKRHGGKSKCGSSKRGKSRGCGRRKKSARRGGRRGKKCAPEGNGGGQGAGEDVFSSSEKRRSRARSFSGARPENRSGSVSLSASDEERLDEKHSDDQAIESPKTLGD